MNVSELLEEKGLKKTPQRILLLNILKERASAMTEDEIKQEMGDMYDRITFYRTVQTLIEVEIIHRIIIDNKTIKYALNTTCAHAQNHAHFFCRICHAVTCLGNIPLNTPPDLLAGNQVEEYEVLVKGVCSECLGS